MTSAQRKLLEEAGITSFADPFTAALVDELGKHPCGRGEAIKELVEQHQPEFAFALVLPHSTTACFEYGYDPLTKELTKPPEGGEALQDGKPDSPTCPLLPGCDVLSRGGLGEGSEACSSNFFGSGENAPQRTAPQAASL